MLHELFIPYELALLAKNKGFDEPCFGLFNPDEEFELLENTRNIENCRNSLVRDAVIMSPLYQQIIDWFREKHYIKFSEIPLDFDEIRYGLSKKGEFIAIWERDKAIEEAFKLIE